MSEIQCFHTCHLSPLEVWFHPWCCLFHRQFTSLYSPWPSGGPVFQKLFIQLISRLEISNSSLNETHQRAPSIWGKQKGISRDGRSLRGNGAWTNALCGNSEQMVMLSLLLSSTHRHTNVCALSLSPFVSLSFSLSHTHTPYTFLTKKHIWVVFLLLNVFPFFLKPMPLMQHSHLLSPLSV